jgi:ParB-like chromosome segregation protein Spo0J
MPVIALKLLDADIRNANVCEAGTLDKIAANIQRTGFCPPLIVRPHPNKEGRYMILDGHHRKLMLERLKWKSVECQVWTINEEDAQLALVTLNRLRGADNLRKRAELIQSLSQTLEIQALACLIPETPPEIETLLSSLQFDFQAMEENLKAQQMAEQATLPVPFTCMLLAEDFALVEKALKLMQQKDRSAALVKLCREVIDRHG